MFVHPIAPVLNETRHVVAPFNGKLQQQVCFSSPPPLVSSTDQVSHQDHSASCSQLYNAVMIILCLSGSLSSQHQMCATTAVLCAAD